MLNNTEIKSFVITIQTYDNFKFDIVERYAERSNNDNNNT